MSHSQWTDAEDRAHRARMLLGQGRWREAADELRYALSINPYNSEWLFDLGCALDELGLHEEAIAAYSKLLAMDASHLHAQNHLGLALYEIGRLGEALEVFVQLEKTDPQFEPSYCNRILVYTELGDHQSAEEMFYTARLYREQCPNCFYNMGISLANRGLHARAVYCWQKTIDLDGEDVEVRAKIAGALVHQGLFEAARRHFIEGLKNDPDHVPTLLEYVKLLIKIARLDEAEQKLAHAERIAGSCASVSFARAGLESARFQTDLVEKSLKQTLHLDPTYSGANLLLAGVAVEKKSLVEARDYLRAELMLRPQSPSLLLDLANMLLDLGEMRLGIACLRRLTQLHPGDVRAWQNLAVAECTRRRYKRGIAVSIHALTLDPLNLTIRHNLALGYLDSGDVDAAQEQVRLGLMQSPNHPLLKRLRFHIMMRRLWFRLFRK